MNCCEPTCSSKPQQSVSPNQRAGFGSGPELRFSSELLMQPQTCVGFTHRSLKHYREKKKHSLQSHALNVIITLNHYCNTLLRAELLLSSPLSSTAQHVSQHNVLASYLIAEKPKPLLHAICIFIQTLDLGTVTHLF